MRELNESLEEKVEERTAALTAEIAEHTRTEDALRKSEEQFRLLVEGVTDYALFMLDPDGRVASWNAGAERIKGFREEEVIGQPVSMLYPPEDVERDEPARQLKQAAETGRFEGEGWRLRKDGSRYFASDIITALRGEVRNLRGFFENIADITERKQVEQRSPRVRSDYDIAEDGGHRHMAEVSRTTSKPVDRDPRLQQLTLRGLQPELRCRAA